jgi:Ca2+-binding EF-hand superfamily protein
MEMPAAGVHDCRKDPLMSTGLLDRKIDRCFGHLDVNRDGQIQSHDLVALAARLMSNFAVPADSRKGKQVTQTFGNWWKALVSNMDVDGDREITPDEFRTGMRATFVTPSGGFDEFFRPAAQAIIDVADTDDDGIVSRHEFRRVQEAFGTPPVKIDEAFARLDADGDGFLSHQEIMDAFRDYYTKEDPQNPGNWLFGSI